MRAAGWGGEAAIAIVARQGGAEEDEDQCREVQGGVDNTRCGREEEECGSIGGRG